MGVTGLWKLVESSGKPVPLETLENKILAIDISIWLHQVVKGFQDNKGNTLPNAHLLGLFHRLCKLLFYKIKPVFVFDGGIPQLKRETIAKRMGSKNKLQSEADRLQQLLLETLAKEKVVQQALGSNVDLLSPQKKIKNAADKDNARVPKDDLFKLPPLKEDLGPSTSFDTTSSSLDDSTSSCDETSARNQLNINSINVESKFFKSLPPDVRHELLVDIKETRKQSSWGRLHELPAQSDDFSLFQMSRLLKRRKVQVSLEEAEKEMGGKCLSMGELENLLNEDGVLQLDDTKKTHHIASNENVRYLLVRDIKKAMENAKEKVEVKDEVSPNKRPKLEMEPVQEIDEYGDEFDDDLERAIRMSLQENVPESTPDDYDSNYAKMTVEQKQQLSNAAMTLARGYMMEYGGMSSEDINDIIALHDKNDEFNETIQDLFKYNDSMIVGSSATQESLAKLEKFIPSKSEHDETISSDGDSDFVEVHLDDFDELPCIPKISVPGKPPPNADISKEFRLEDLKLKEKILEVVIKPEDIKDEADDLFADVFNDIVKEESKISNKNDSSNSIIEEVIPDPITHVNISRESENNIEQINENIQTEIELMRNKLNMNTLSKEILTKSTETFIPEYSKEESKTEVNLMDDSDCDSDATVILNESNIEDALKLANSTVIERGEIEEPASLGICTVIEEEIKEPAPFENIANLTVAEQIKHDLDKQLEELKKQTLRIDSGIVKCSASAEVIQILDSSHEIIEIIEDQRVSDLEKTPKKKIAKGDEIVPKVPSPFFVKRTPPSSKKKNSDNAGSGQTNSKVSKSLFPAESLADTIESAAKVLKDNKTEAELVEIASQLAQEERDLIADRNKQERMGTNITQKMSVECMNLLKLFGIPYIKAPMEAEAQCAFLNLIELTDGTITDDSDIWLFGGKTVYKNFFNQQKLVMEFKNDVIEKCFNMDRKKLIQLAMLVGSDYTDGINGIGAVTALEILATFPNTPTTEGETSDKMSTLSGLRKFSEWFQNGKSVGPHGRTALKSKLRNIQVTDRFPNPNIVDAYLYPKVDSSSEQFSWGKPDAESIREFAKQNFGWTSSKTDDLLLPVLKKLDEKKNQQAITNYFRLQTSVKSMDNLKISKRVKKAVDKMSGTLTSDGDEKVVTEKPKRKTKKKAEAPPNDADANQPSTSKGTTTRDRILSKVAPVPRKRKISKPKPDEIGGVASKTSVISKINSISANSLPETAPKIARIPNPSDVIPQREKTLEELKIKKARAAEIFKKSKESLEKNKKKA